MVEGEDKDPRARNVLVDEVKWVNWFEDEGFKSQQI
jgi:hypothetical protein